MNSQLNLAEDDGPSAIPGMPFVTPANVVTFPSISIALIVWLIISETYRVFEKNAKPAGELKVATFQSPSL